MRLFQDRIDFPRTYYTMLKGFLCSIKQLYTLNSLCRPVPVDMCLLSTILKLLEENLF